MSSLTESLRESIGSDAVVTGPDVEPYTRCTTRMARTVVAVVFPHSTDEVVNVVQIAVAHAVAVYPVSTGRNWGYGTANPVIDGCVVINLSRMNRIVEGPDPVTGLVTLEPGVTQGDLADYLKREGLPFMVPATGAGPSVSIVGNALERGYGLTPITDHFLAVTDIEAVLPDGSVYRSPFSAMTGGGSGRMFKWGIGPYLDGLFAQGSFGVITKMTIALARRPDRIKAFVFGIKTESQLEPTVTAIQSVLARLPGAVGGINVMNARRILAMAAPYPRDRIPANGVISPALLTQLQSSYRVTPWTVFGTVFGTREVVAAAEKEIRRICAPTSSRLLFMSAQTAERLHGIVQKMPMVPIVSAPLSALLRLR